MVGDISMKEAIRIAVLDDHQLFREGLVRLLATEPGFVVVGHFSTIDEALAAMTRETLDVILLDYDLGTEVANNFLACVSVLKPTPRILMVTAGMTEQARREAFALGALEVVLKHRGPRDLIDAIHRAAKAKATPEHKSLVQARPLRAEADRGVLRSQMAAPSSKTDAFCPCTASRGCPHISCRRLLFRFGVTARMAIPKCCA